MLMYEKRKEKKNRRAAHKKMTFKLIKKQIN